MLFPLFAPVLQSMATPVFEPVQALVIGPRSPYSRLIQGNDGNFYGTSFMGGNSGGGTVFRMTPAGVLTNLVNFNSTNGAWPSDGLIRGIDGNYYGTTQIGGANNNGTVFKVTPSGVHSILASFNRSTNGDRPYGGVVQGSDGNFYGTTYQGGTSGYGTVFKVTPGGTLSTMLSFTGTNGRNPRFALVQGNDGDFYGTTDQGGAWNYGTVFKVTPTGVLTTLKDLQYGNSTSALLRGSDGNFYGMDTTYFGSVFKITPSGTMTTLAMFNTPNGRTPEGGLVEGSDGNFYGTTHYGPGFDFGSVFRMTPTGEITTLETFDKTNGQYPLSSLVQGSDGNFYGTTTSGGNLEHGTAFRMSPSGDLTTLHHFGASNGHTIQAGLVQGADGNFYGTTAEGGINGNYGTIFKMTPAGTLSTLVNFYPEIGIDPYSPLVFGPDGNLYGTTSHDSITTYGTIFKVTPSGDLTTLVNFKLADGSFVKEGLLLASDGNFYGTTYQGGSNDFGTLFKMTPGGTLTVLVHFTGANGSYPDALLMQGNDGNLYGTTSRGGTSNNGTVFKVTTGGLFTTLANFNSTNGSLPRAALLQGSDGNFWGTASRGGSSNYGTVFKMTPGGTLTTMVTFTGANGNQPLAGLVAGGDGHLYGTTNDGGTASDGQRAGGGQIYRLRMGPTVTNLSPVNVTSTGASLQAMVNPGGYATSVSFRYGKDPSLATYNVVQAATLPAGSTNTTVQAPITGLKPGSKYYHTVVVSNAENPVPQTAPALGFTTTGSQSPYDSWAETRFTEAQLADALVSGHHADPDSDGICNLLECAFNMFPLSPGNEILVPVTGTSGLPLISKTGSGATARLRMEYIRRKAGFTYTPQASSALGEPWRTATGSQSVEPINSDWERVVVEEAIQGQLQRFGRVKVTTLE